MSGDETLQPEGGEEFQAPETRNDQSEEIVGMNREMENLEAQKAQLIKKKGIFEFDHNFLAAKENGLSDIEAILVASGATKYNKEGVITRNDAPFHKVRNKNVEDEAKNEVAEYKEKKNLTKLLNYSVKQKKKILRLVKNSAITVLPSLRYFIKTSCK